MENPFLQLKKLNFKLKLIIAILVIGIVATYMATSGYLEEKYLRYIESNKQLTEEAQKNNVELKKAKDELKKKEDELKHYTLTKQIISDFIAKENTSLPHKEAEKYAVKIIQESKRRGHSPYVQAALLASESSFRNNPKHAIRTVIGMGGIYYDVWQAPLKDEGIVRNIDSLKNPYVNIAASAYVMSCYTKRSVNIRTALAKYKGYCSLGRSQANDVMSVAIMLKQKEKESNA